MQAWQVQGPGPRGTHFLLAPIGGVGLAYLIENVTTPPPRSGTDETQMRPSAPEPYSFPNTQTPQFFAPTMEACCTCARLLSAVPLYSEKSEKLVPQDRLLGCCRRTICGDCLLVRPPSHLPSRVSSRTLTIPEKPTLRILLPLLPNNLDTLPPTPGAQGTALLHILTKPTPNNRRSSPGIHLPGPALIPRLLPFPAPNRETRTARLPGTNPPLSQPLNRHPALPLPLLLRPHCPNPLPQPPDLRPPPRRAQDNPHPPTLRLLFRLLFGGTTSGISLPRTGRRRGGGDKEEQDTPVDGGDQSSGLRRGCALPRAGRVQSRAGRGAVPGGRGVGEGTSA